MRRENQKHQKKNKNKRKKKKEDQKLSAGGYLESF